MKGMEMSKYKIIAICGKSSTGKSTVASWLFQEMRNSGYKVSKIISNTTRPPRQMEMNGVDYNFCNASTFVGEGYLQDYLEWTYFNHWLYGTPMSALDKDVENCYNIGVFNPSGIKQLIERDDVDLFVVYLKDGAKTRVSRSFDRESKPSKKEIFRRFWADFRDFRKFEYWLVDDGRLIRNRRIWTVKNMDGSRDKALSALFHMEDSNYLRGRKL